MVSVIIPSYNRAATIERSVRSVLGQTYKDLECIVVDDGSADNTQEIISAIADPRLRYYRLNQNRGACVARNKGIDLAKGEYIAFQDSDDVWLETKLETQLRAMHSSNSDVCFCALRRFYNNKGSGEEWPIGLKKGIVSYEELYVSPRTSTQTILAKTIVFKDFKFDEKLKKSQDYDWTLRSGECYTFYFVNKDLVTQYFQADSITIHGEKDFQIGKEVYQYLYDKFEDKYKNYPGLEIALLNRLSIWKVLDGENAAWEYFRLYHLTDGRKEYLKYLVEKTAPGILKQWIMHKHRKNVRHHYIL